jgi:hypothetical protein
MYKTLLTLFIAIIIFAGCSKSGGTVTPKTGGPIIGKWYLVSDSVTQYVNNVRSYIFIDDGVVPGTYRSFNADGTGVDYTPANGSESASSTNVTYTLSDNKLSFNYPAQDIDGSHFDPRTDVYTVITLTKNNLGIKYIDAGTDNKGNQSVMTQYYYYTR